MTTTTIIHQPIKTFALTSLGLLARCLVISSFKDTLRHRVEVTTPISDWKRAHEAIYLLDSGLDPYSGNLFHEYPISLQLYKIISNYLNVDLAFALTDTLTAILLSQSVFHQLTSAGKSSESASSQSTLILLIYLFSPINIISCAGQSTTIFTNFLIASIYLILPMRPFRVLTCVLCAFLACNNIHFSSLILPIFLCMEFHKHKRQQRISGTNNDSSISNPSYYDNQEFFSAIWTSISICVTSIATLLIASYLLMGNSWSFVKSTYLFVLYVQDLTPNIGAFWYFFTEMFEHFLNFFTWIVQINSFIHVLPLSVYLRDQPYLAFYITLLASTIFQPYPNLANIGLVTSLLPQFSELFPHMKHGFFIACSAITCISLMPIFWHLWILMGTANSNFYFGATLAFMATLILLMIDLLNAHLNHKVSNLVSQHTHKKKEQ